MGQAGHKGRKAFILFLEKYFSDQPDSYLLVCGKPGKLRNVECREFEVDWVEFLKGGTKEAGVVSSSTFADIRCQS